MTTARGRLYIHDLRKITRGGVSSLSSASTASWAAWALSTRECRLLALLAGNPSSASPQTPSFEGVSWGEDEGEEERSHSSPGLKNASNRSAHDSCFLSRTKGLGSRTFMCMPCSMYSRSVRPFFALWMACETLFRQRLAPGVPVQNLPPSICVQYWALTSWRKASLRAVSSLQSVS